MNNFFATTAAALLAFSAPIAYADFVANAAKVLPARSECSQSIGNWMATPVDNIQARNKSVQAIGNACLSTSTLPGI